MARRLAWSEFVVHGGCGREYLRALAMSATEVVPAMEKGHAFQYLAGFWGGHFDFHDGLVDAPRIQDECVCSQEAWLTPHKEGTRRKRPGPGRTMSV